MKSNNYIMIDIVKYICIPFKSLHNAQVIDDHFWENIDKILEREEKFNIKHPSVSSFCEKDWTCCICLSSIENNQYYKMLDCNHYFHEECITQWIADKQKNSCPLCKKQVFRG